MGIIKWNGPILMGVQKKKGNFFFFGGDLLDYIFQVQDHKEQNKT